MTSNQTYLDNVIMTIYRAGTAGAQLEYVQALYASVYAEPPYCENPSDVESFVASWSKQLHQSNFRLVVARNFHDPIGFAFGYRLGPETLWWQGVQEEISPVVTNEYPGRTFAVIELATARPHRRHGIGRELHTHLLAGLSEKRATLLVRPEARAAQHAYRRWGYQVAVMK